MSNMNKPVQVPQGLEVEAQPAHLRLRGPVGELTLDIAQELEMQYNQSARVLTVSRRRNDRRSRSLHGLYRSLIANMVEGVSKGFQKALEVHGTGYSVEIRGRNLVLQVGFCHEVVFEIPEGIDVEVQQRAAQPDNPAKFTLRGADKARLGQFAAGVRAARPPEPYKGKGIRYAGEQVRRKEGKAFATAQA